MFASLGALSVKPPNVLSAGFTEVMFRGWIAQKIYSTLHIVFPAFRV